MTAILTDLSRHALALACEANWREGFLEMMERWERGEVHREPEVVWFRSDLAHPLLNSVLTCRFDEERVDEVIARVLERFRERSLPLWWWTLGSSRPADLGARLERAGLVREADLPGMGGDLARLPAEPPLPAGFAVERVGSEAALAQWAEAYERGFPMERAVAAAHVEIFAAVGFGPKSRWRHYVGLYEGRPVASSSVYLGAGVAGLYYVAVVPEARGRGIGTAMVVKPLREAYQSGYRAGILQTTTMGRPIYERLGFAEVALYPQYRWTP